MTRRSTRLQILITLALALLLGIGTIFKVPLTQHLIAPLIGMTVFIFVKICFHKHLPVIAIAIIAFLSILLIDGVFPNLQNGEGLFAFSMEEFSGILMLTLIDTTVEEVVEYETEHLAKK